MIKKIISRLMLLLVTIFLGGGLAIYLFKDKIIQRVVSQVNTYLTTPVQVEKIDIDFLHGFPNVAVRFNYVFMESGFGETLLEAEQIHMMVSPLNLIGGGAEIESIELRGGEINLLVDKRGKANYQVINIDSTSSNKTGDITLKSIRLIDVELAYKDERTPFELFMDLQNISGKFSLKNGVFSPSVTGDLHFSSLENDGFILNVNKDLHVQLESTYNDSTDLLELQPSKLSLLGTDINLNGQIDFTRGSQTIDLGFDSPNATISIVSLFLSDNLNSLLREYQSKGDINFSGKLKGTLANPGLSSQFQMDRVTLTQPKYEANIEDLNLEGELAIGRLSNLKTGKLIINNGKGRLAQKEFNFSASISDFISPNVEFDFDGRVGAKWTANLLKYEKRASVSGDVLAKLSYTSSGHGKAKQEFIRGNLSLVEVNLDLINDQTVSQLNGDIAFAPELISITELSGLIGETDFSLNGEVVGIRNYSLLEGSNARLRAQLKSEYVDLDEITNGLITLSENRSQSSSALRVPDLDMHLEFLISSLSFKKFRGSQILGRLNYSKNILEVDKFSSRTMGGKVDLSGVLKTETNGDYYIESFVKTDGIHIDSVFNVFNNFQQNFITDEFLKGQVNSEVLATMYFDKNWRLRRNLLITEAQIRVLNGELNNFQPIMELSRYLDDREDHLDQLRFAELTNYINIKNDTVFIPEMNIKTNVRDIRLAGSHTLSQHIDYRLVVPVINENIDNDEAFGAVERIENASPNLHFKILGTTTDYKVSYDLARAVQKAIDILDLKKTFKKREEKMDSVALDEEEFDW